MTDTDPGFPADAIAEEPSTSTHPYRTPSAPATELRRTVEDWREVKAIDPHLFAGLRVGQRWAIGTELTEQQFDEAVEALHSIVVR